MKFRIDLKILFFLGLFYLTGQLEIYLLVLIFAFLHEISHLLVGICLGFKPKSIEMMPFGFGISLRPKIEDYKKKIFKSNVVDLKYIFIAIAGPLFNLIFAVVFGSLFNISEEMSENRQMIIYSNLLLFILNLVPIYPLDGARIFRSMLRIFYGKKIADKKINDIANTFIILLTIAGSIGILYFKNIAIFIILIYLWELVIMENKRLRLKKRLE